MANPQRELVLPLAEVEELNNSYECPTGRQKTDAIACRRLESCRFPRIPARCFLQQCVLAVIEACSISPIGPGQKGRCYSSSAAPIGIFILAISRTATKKETQRRKGAKPQREKRSAPHIPFASLRLCVDQPRLSYAWHAVPTSRQVVPVINLKLREYLELLDWTGREGRKDKRGKIPRFVVANSNQAGHRRRHVVRPGLEFQALFSRDIGRKPVQHESRCRGPRAEMGAWPIRSANLFCRWLKSNQQNNSYAVPNGRRKMDAIACRRLESCPFPRMPARAVSCNNAFLRSSKLVQYLLGPGQKGRCYSIPPHLSASSYLLFRECEEKETQRRKGAKPQREKRSAPHIPLCVLAPLR